MNLAAIVLLTVFCVSIRKTLVLGMSDDSSTAEVSGPTTADKQRLAQDLMSGYLSYIEPGDLEVSFGIKVLCSRFDAQSNIATTNVWERTTWTDSRLSWQPEDYGGVNVLRLPAKQIWTPDIRLYNSISSFEQRDRDVNAVVFNDGSVMWIPPATYRTYCSGNEHRAQCFLHLGSWSYDAFKLELKKQILDDFELSEYSSLCPWSISESTARISVLYYECCSEPYPSFDFNMTLVARHNDNSD